MWDTELEAARQAAQQAGQVLLDWMGRFSVRRKSGYNDLVTEADFAAQETVLGILRRRFPNDRFIAEEEDPQAGSNAEASRCWYIDPLDGTTNYVHGFGFFCVSIGLVQDGRPVVGIIYDPTRQECFAAAAGHGTTCNDVPLHSSGVDRLADALICGGLPNNVNEQPEELRIFSEIARRVQSIRRTGSSALALAYVAAGRVDGFWASQLMPWDAAAGVILTREAGGNVTTLDGEPFTVDSPPTLATNGVLHPELVAAIASTQPARLE